MNLVKAFTNLADNAYFSKSECRGEILPSFAQYMYINNDSLGLRKVLSRKTIFADYEKVTPFTRSA